MKATPKAKSINDFLKTQFGVDREQSVAIMKCVHEPIGCGQEVDPTKWDELTQREYQISGLCKECQDAIFG